MFFSWLLGRAQNGARIASFNVQYSWQEKRNFDFVCYRAIKCQFLSNVFFDDLASQ